MGLAVIGSVVVGAVMGNSVSRTGRLGSSTDQGVAKYDRALRDDPARSRFGDLVSVDDNYPDIPLSTRAAYTAGIVPRKYGEQLMTVWKAFGGFVDFTMPLI